MGDSETGQVSEDAAKIYEDVYLPSLFQEWCPLIVQAAKITTGDTVVDIACGTGALTTEVAKRVGLEGKTVGVDINEGMLNIARSKSSTIEWHNSPAEKLPFPNNSFDRVVCQFGLMYFEDQEAAVREMIRVLKPGGSLAVAVWDTLSHNPGLAAEEYLWQQVFGEEVDGAPYRLGDKNTLQNLFVGSGASELQLKTHEGTARFESIRSWIHTGAKGWTDDDALTEDELELLLGTAERVLTEFRTQTGSVRFPTSAHIVSAVKQRSKTQNPPNKRIQPDAATPRR